MNMKYTAVALVMAISAAPVMAQDYVVYVHGIVCELCSFGVAKKVRKLSFVDATKYQDGVRVDVANQHVYVAVRDDAELDQAALFAAIESGGYAPVKLWAVSASGEHVELAP